MEPITEKKSLFNKKSVVAFTIVVAGFIGFSVAQSDVFASAEDKQADYKSFIQSHSREFNQELGDLNDIILYDYSKTELDQTLEELDEITDTWIDYPSYKVPKKYKDFHKTTIEAMESFNYVATNLSKAMDKGDESKIKKIFETFEDGQVQYENALYELQIANND